MDYFEAREYLDEISVSGSILGLETIQSLMNELGNPQDRLKVIHIAGTNGKGSILAITESILKTAGYTVGAYCSPSVMGYLEKFRINGNWMAEEELAPLTEQVKAAAEAVVEKGSAMPTVFEFETAVAFLHFCQKECDYVLLETGLGGDLDSTNVMANTEICAFGPISMDHTGVLGGSIEEIAEKKAGIIKPGATVIEGWQSKRAASVLEARAEELGCRLVKIDRLSLRELGSDRKNKLQRFDYGAYKGLELGLLGAHQIENASTAIEIIEELRRKGADISEDALREGLAKSSWPCRLEILKTQVESTPEYILDGAHNPAAALALRSALEDFYRGKNVHAVMGIFADKDYRKVAGTLAGIITKAYAIQLPDSSRSLAPEELAEVFAEHETEAEVYETLEMAINAATTDAQKDGGVVLVTGSLSHLGAARKHITGEGNAE